MLQMSFSNRVIVQIFFIALTIGIYKNSCGEIINEASNTTIETKQAQAVPLEGKIQLDGLLNENAWLNAPVINSFHQREPNEGEPASQKTEVRLIYSPRALYVGVKCFDSEPDRIVNRYMQRDSYVYRDDSIHIVLDPFHNGQSGYMFSTNALGARFDASISGFQKSGRRSLQRIRQYAYPNKDWNGVWNVKTTRNDEGWNAEFEIPFATLKFPQANDHAWGLNLRRMIPRNSEESIWASHQRNLGFYALSHAGDLNGLENMEQGIGLDIKPYTLTHYNIDREDIHDEDLMNQEGLDLSYSITSNIQMDLTVNPDFAETEVDEQPLDLSRFPLFFPEKRRFFLEGASVFRFGSQYRATPYHSRRIGINDDEKPVSILFGSKVTGTHGNTQFGWLGAMSNENGAFPRTTYNIARVQQRIFDESNIGAIITTMMPDGGDGNHVAGIDGSFVTNLWNDDRIRTDVYAMQSISEKSGGDDFVGNIIVSYPNDPWDASVGYSHIGPEFNPEIGYVRVTGIDRWDSDLAYNNDIDNSIIRRTVQGIEGEYSIDHEGDPFQNSLELVPLGLVFQSGEYLEYKVEYEEDNVKEEYDIFGDVIIGPDSYDGVSHWLAFRSSSKRPVRVMMHWQGGDDLNGTYNDYSADIIVQFTRNFLFSLEGTIDERKYPLTPAPDSGVFGGAFTANLLRVRATYTFSPDLYITSYLQWENESELASLNNRLHWTIEPERDLFVVVNLATDRGESRFIHADTAIKLGYLWRF